MSGQAVLCLAKMDYTWLHCHVVSSVRNVLHLTMKGYTWPDGLHLAAMCYTCLQHLDVLHWALKGYI